uniref:Uncharacterized protein n=1 Tax=Rheinheimera sp. BAL341 TaxID=1708203 RepID=A0A486XKU6_9GAMM
MQVFSTFHHNGEHNEITDINAAADIWQPNGSPESEHTLSAQ